MSALVNVSLFLLLATGANAAPVSDTVNERIPVNAADLEAHWRVDCADISLRLRELAGRLKAGVGCQVDSALRHQLQLCAFIYQAPGSTSRHVCPNYRDALDALNRADPGDDCADIAVLLLDPQHCSPPGKVD